MASGITNQTSWTMDIGTETRPCSTRICERTSVMNLSAKSSILPRNSTALSVWAATRMYLTGTTDSVNDSSQSNRHIHDQFSSHFWIKSNTSLIIPSKLLIKAPSLSDFTNFLSRLSWPARLLMLSARYFIASRDSSWALKCWKSTSHTISVERRESGPLCRENWCNVRLSVL